MGIQVVGRGLDKKAVRAIEENIIKLLPVELVSRHSGDDIEIVQAADTEPGLDVLAEQIELAGV